MSMISYDTARKLFVFRQFHTEGFVNTYVQQPSTDDKAFVFVSEDIENIPAGYRARETYTILSRDEFTERSRSRNRQRFRVVLRGALEARPLASHHGFAIVSASGPGRSSRSQAHRGGCHPTQNRSIVGRQTAGKAPRC